MGGNDRLLGGARGLLGDGGGLSGGARGLLGDGGEVLRLRCERSEDGKVRRKEESAGQHHDVYEYEYDEQGRLIQVLRNGFLREQYRYNAKGQREGKGNGRNHQDILYDYDKRGCLVLTRSQEKQTHFYYDEQGNLALKTGDCRWSYHYQDTRLRDARSPYGTRLDYAYGQEENPLGPVAVYQNGDRRPILEYTWKDLTRLASCVDRRIDLHYAFEYEGQFLAQVRLWGAKQPETTLLVGCDQVGTPKVFRDQSGQEMKYVDYDSFGIPLADSNPYLFIPVGFAGGLVDEFTGFVRFGYRDYDPEVGRFTCPDPALDLRGDGDIYDYCVDDPVGRQDPFGLWTQETFDEAKVRRDGQGQFSGGGSSTGTRGVGGSVSGVTLRTAAAKGVLLGEAADTRGGESIQTLPKAPPPVPDNRPLTRFEELVLKEGLSDRETLPQYYKVASGGSLNAGHSKGFETKDLKANDDILVYVKNSNIFAVPLEVKAGSSFTKNEMQSRVILPNRDAVFRFRNPGQLIQYLSIDSQADSFLVEYQIFSRGEYALR